MEIVREASEGVSTSELAARFGVTPRAIQYTLRSDAERQRDAAIPVAAVSVKVTPEELATGIQTAFSEADTNQDGYLSPLEQLAWAERQPVRDDTLGNPARFDPNLDRRASYDEFQTVISSLADDYASESGVIQVSDLKAPRREKRELAENDRPVRPMPRN